MVCHRSPVTCHMTGLMFGYITSLRLSITLLNALESAVSLKVCSQHDIRLNSDWAGTRLLWLACAADQVQFGDFEFIRVLLSLNRFYGFHDYGSWLILLLSQFTCLRWLQLLALRTGHTDGLFCSAILSRGDGMLAKVGTGDRPHIQGLWRDQATSGTAAIRCSDSLCCLLVENRLLRHLMGRMTVV